MNEPTCPYCNEPCDVTDLLGVWQATWGWAPRAGKRRSGHKVSGDLYHRQPLQKWAHAACVRREKSGVSARQEALQ